MIVTQPLQIRVWQKSSKLIPIGARGGKTCPLGFAELSFTLINETEQPLSLELTTIEVRPIGRDEPLMSLPEQNIQLNPLEAARQQYQLCRRQGYGSAEWVEAIVVYQVGGQRYTLFSSPVYVQPMRP